MPPHRSKHQKHSRRAYVVRDRYHPYPRPDYTNSIMRETASEQYNELEPPLRERNVEPEHEVVVGERRWVGIVLKLVVALMIVLACWAVKMALSTESSSDGDDPIAGEEA
ncbi:hypothetical protein PC9H_000060 [Pleurotus ostreatus]|uniref:Uncharacterized protein n=1 Tax=Pleurotus ostreatus TaxID=5322 RepID=A0A8H7A3F8_PLEOS|nr:uncharacterized protein PC9H_000060 [Pleurotus ostreatus]KAF7439724.1 hypothetical protein PC9H_000060 [Pleurotus ostreatus]